MSISRMKDSAGTTHDIIAGGITYATCGTAAGTAAKEATVSAGVFNLFTGAKVTVKFTYANTVASPTLNVASTGAKAIYWHGAALASSQYWAAGAVLDFVYDGSYWNLVGVAKDNNTTYTIPTSLKNPNALTIKGAGTTVKTYDGSAAVSVDWVAGNNVTITPDATNGKITIAATGANTTYTFETGDGNGQIKVTPSGGSAQNVSVKGLGSAAYTDSSAYAAASHGTHLTIGTGASNAAAGNHTHKYAGSSSVGGAATSANKVNKSLSIQLNGGTTEGTDMFTFNGSADKTVNITPSAIGAAAASHGTHLTIGTSSTTAAAGNHTHKYAGSSSVGGAATSANKVNTSLTIKLNGGSTEGTNLFTFNGSAAKSIDITPSAIGAAAASHGTHLTIGTGASNAAAGNHTHSYLPLSGGTLNGNLTGKYITGTWLQTTSSSNLGSAAAKICVLDSAGWVYYRTAAEILSDIGAAAASHGTHLTIGTGASNAAAGNHTHNYAGSSSAGGAATSANKVNTNLVIKLNSGTTEGTNMFTFNGSAAKSINITPSAIGAAKANHGTHLTIGTTSTTAAAGNHTHSGYVPTSRTINGKALSSNISLTASDVGAAKASHGTHLTIGTTSTTAAAGNHTHSQYAPAYTYSTTDLTAGSSSLTTGKLYFVYE